jgi:uncharacterized membrane protein YcaP (DUF421 family)
MSTAREKKVERFDQIQYAILERRGGIPIIPKRA